MFLKNSLKSPELEPWWGMRSQQPEPRSYGSLSVKKEFYILLLSVIGNWQRALHRNVTWPDFCFKRITLTAEWRVDGIGRVEERRFLLSRVIADLWATVKVEPTNLPDRLALGVIPRLGAQATGCHWPPWATWGNGLGRDTGSLVWAMSVWDALWASSGQLCLWVWAPRQRWGCMYQCTCNQQHSRWSFHSSQTWAIPYSPSSVTQQYFGQD